MIYNRELIFAMNEEEGVSAFSFGIGSRAILPCGKSDVMNKIAIPNNKNNSVFNVSDNTIFSNGQVDVFFDKCYQDRTGWVLMDAQGNVTEEVILSVLSLTNIVFIHFH